MNGRWGRGWMVWLALTLICVTGGCTTQRILGPSPVDEATPGDAFENSGYSWYLVCGSVPIYRCSVPQLIAEVNPNQHLVHTWRATSQGRMRRGCARRWRAP